MTSRIVSHNDNDQPVRVNGHDQPTTNGHISFLPDQVLSKVNHHAEQNAATTSTSWPSLIPISANSAISAQRRADSLQEYLQSRSGFVREVAHTLGLHRAHLSYRAFCILRDQDDARGRVSFSAPESLRITSADEPKVVYVFTGQGAQSSGMGRTLIQTSPTFLRDVQTMDDALQKLSDPPTWKIEGRVALFQHAAVLPVY